MHASKYERQEVIVFACASVGPHIHACVSANPRLRSSSTTSEQYIAILPRSVGDFAASGRRAVAMFVSCGFCKCTPPHTAVKWRVVACQRGFIDLTDADVD